MLRSFYVIALAGFLVFAVRTPNESGYVAVTDRVRASQRSSPSPLPKLDVSTQREPSNTNKPPGNTNKPPGNTNKPPGNTNKPPGNTNKPPGNTNKPPGNTNQASGRNTNQASGRNTNQASGRNTNQSRDNRSRGNNNRSRDNTNRDEDANRYGGTTSNIPTEPTPSPSVLNIDPRIMMLLVGLLIVILLALLTGYRIFKWATPKQPTLHARRDLGNSTLNKGSQTLAIDFQLQLNPGIAESKCEINTRESQLITFVRREND